MSLPCGTGKTVIFTEYIKNHINEKFIIIVPLINIAINLKDKYFGNNANYIWTNTNINNNSNISIYVYDSFKKYFNGQSFNDYTLIIDEAHHIYKPSYYCSKNDSDESNDEFIEKLEQSFKKIIAVSATIEDADYQYNINEAIKNHYISDFRIDINFLPTNDNEFYLINAIEHYKYRLIFCNTIENANNIRIILSKYISSQISIIDANTKQEDRIKIIDEFQNNEDNIIISINTLNEGVDIPCAESCIFIDDRSSPVNIIQCMGRVMRNYPGKLYGKIVLFANCEDNAEKKYYKYINAINLAYNIDVNELKSKIRLFYDYSGYSINNINKCNDLMFNQIIRYNFTFEEQIQLAKIFYEKYKRKPEKDETIKFDNDDRIYDIYRAIIRAKHHKTKLYYEFLKIFGDLNERHIFNGDPIEVCKLFKQEFNCHPRSTDILYHGLNIYSYYCRVKNSNSPELKAKLIEIFGDFSKNMNTRVNIDNKNHNNLIELTKKYIQNYGQIEPNYRLLLDSSTGLKCDANNPNKVRFGHIINEMKNGRKYQSIKDVINELFGNKLIKINPEQEYADKCNDIIKLHLDKTNNIKWDNVKFTVENESSLNLKYSAKQLNSFIAHTRENINSCNKFNEYMKNQNIDFRLISRQSKNEALKEQMIVIGKYYLQYKTYPKQQGKDENEMLMKKLKSRKDSDKYFRIIENCIYENDLINKINELC
jgi:superfamily II DNA or RNA helicase